MRLLACLLMFAPGLVVAQQMSGYCGDGIVQGDESCDDGNLIDTDACPSNCRLLPASPESQSVTEERSGVTPMRALFLSMTGSVAGATLLYFVPGEVPAT